MDNPFSAQSLPRTVLPPAQVELPPEYLFLPIPLVPLLGTTLKIPQDSHKDEWDKLLDVGMAELRAMSSDHSLRLQREKKLSLGG